MPKIYIRYKSLPEFVYFEVEICHRRPRFFASSQKFAQRQNIKYAVLGWGRQIFAKSSQAMGITAVTINACQCNMENDTRGKNVT